jgi:hypothetical protein
MSRPRSDRATAAHLVLLFVAGALLKSGWEAYLAGTLREWEGFMACGLLAAFMVAGTVAYFSLVSNRASPSEGFEDLVERQRSAPSQSWHRYTSSAHPPGWLPTRQPPRVRTPAPQPADEAPEPRPVDEAVFGPVTLRVLPGQRCPFCRDDVSGQTYACSDCKTIYHSACLREAGGCTTLGCTHAAPRRRRGA